MAQVDLYHVHHVQSISLLPQKSDFTVVYKTEASSQLFSQQPPPGNSLHFTQYITLKSIKLFMQQAKCILIMFFIQLYLPLEI